VQLGCLKRMKLARRQTLFSLSVACLLIGPSVRGQDVLLQWHDPLSQPASSAAEPRSPVRFVWEDEEFDETSESNPIRRTAYQDQYPLSKDSEDLLPHEDHWRRVEEESASEITDRFANDEAPWIEWKKTIGTATWIAPNTDGLGVTSLDVRGSLEFPDFQALWFVPRIAAHFLSGSAKIDLPTQLYDTSFETIGMLPIGERWFVQAAIAPSFFTDSQNTGRKALRLPGRALAFWKYSDTLTLTGGILYLDRDDVNAIPSAGLLWNPNADWKFELAAPRPRIAWRFSHDDESARWAYLVGEFGGGTWAVRRASGLNDVATLSDYRVMAGYERKWVSGRGWLVEAGYVFSRTLEYTSTPEEIQLPSTAIVRLGITF